MIEFRGFLSGNAEKHFWNKSRKLVQKLLLASTLFLLPIILYGAYQIQSWGIIVCYAAACVAIQACTYIPKSKKEKMAFTPKRIYTEDGYIICVGEKYEEYKEIADVEKVIDYGDFYELLFPFGKISDKFICQKDLLIKGKLEDFESLFEGKIRRKK